MGQATNKCNFLLIPASLKSELTDKARAVLIQNGQIPIIVNDAYLPTMFRRERFQVRYGGSDSGKSDVTATEILLRALQPEYFRCVFSRKFKEQVRDSQFLLFKDLIKRYELEQYFRVLEGPTDIHCTLTGNMLLGAGLDDIDKLKSLPDITAWWIEEPLDRNGSITLEDFTEIDRRVRSALASNHIFLTFNPINKKNWIYEQFFEKESFTPALKVKTTYLDNFFCSEDAREKFERLKGISQNEYNVYALGDWGLVRPGGEAYHSFNVDNQVNDIHFLPDIPVVHLSFDQNVEPYITMLCSQVQYLDNGTLQIRIFREYCLKHPRSQTRALCEDFLIDYGGKVSEVFFYGDRNGGNRRTSGRENDYDIVQSALREKVSSRSNRVQRSNPNIRKRVLFLCYVFEGRIPGIEIVIDRGCENLIDDLLYIKGDANGEKVKERVTEKGVSFEKRGHTSDALDYLCTTILDKQFNNFERLIK